MSATSNKRTTDQPQDRPQAVDASRDEQPSMDPGKLDEAVARDDAGQRAAERRGYLTRVDIEGAGDPIDNQVIGDMTFGRDANGKVAFVDFGGIKSKAHYAGE
jgi:hypothetical protein